MRQNIVIPPMLIPVHCQPEHTGSLRMLGDVRPYIENMKTHNMPGSRWRLSASPGVPLHQPHVLRHAGLHQLQRQVAVVRKQFPVGPVQSNTSAFRCPGAVGAQPAVNHSTREQYESAPYFRLYCRRHFSGPSTTGRRLSMVQQVGEACNQYSALA
jgi:hypothetical protein